MRTTGQLTLVVVRTCRRIDAADPCSPSRNVSDLAKIVLYL
jgi:hypothetical protein